MYTTTPSITHMAISVEVHTLVVDCWCGLVSCAAMLSLPLYMSELLLLSLPLYMSELLLFKRLEKFISLIVHK
jgi:hypothetical protein